VEIILKDAGKRFGAEWIFRNVNYTFQQGGTYAILGRNGSGKSTFLQIIAGNLLPTSGSVEYRDSGTVIPSEKVFHHLTLCAPYQELIEEFNLEEMLKFHFSFKTIIPGFDQKKLTEMLGFRVVRHKPIRSFSSGMKQRVKLLLAIMSESKLVLLDEPTMNLDAAGSEWYLDLIRTYSGDRTVVVCSNLEQLETGFCREKISIEDYK
jgi:ABC-type multidrug transport system ATPase subunit